MAGLGSAGGRGVDFLLVGYAQLSTVLTRLGAIQARLDDTRPLLRAMVPVLQRQYARQYASGFGWAPLDPSTLLHKLTGRVLVNSGRLQASMTGGPGNVQRLSRGSLFYGTSVPYAAPLAAGKRNMPARDPARLNLQAFQREAGQVAAEYVTSTGGRLRLGT